MSVTQQKKFHESATPSGIRYYRRGAEHEKRILFLHGIWMPPLAYRGVFQIPGYEIVMPYIYGAAYLGQDMPQTYDDTFRMVLRFMQEYEIAEGHKDWVAIGHSAGGFGAMHCVQEGLVEKAMAVNPALNAFADLVEFYRRNLYMILTSPPTDILKIGTNNVSEFLRNISRGYAEPELIQTFCEAVIKLPHPEYVWVLYSDQDELIREYEYDICYRHLKENFIKIPGKPHGWPIFESELFNSYIVRFLEGSL